MFGHSFFGAHFYGPNYYGSVTSAAPTNTPGWLSYLKYGHKREDEAEKLARRIREGTIQLPPEPVEPAQKDDSAYYRESARMARQIAKARQDAAESRKAIAELEAQAELLRQSEISQAKLLRAQQALLKAEIEEAIFLEEMEVIDIAFFAVAALAVIKQ
jgi:hypothetical protein